MTKQKQQSKIVTVGGGTGQFTLSLGLKDHPIEQEAVVTVADSGGDSGRKRVEYGILPPGNFDANPGVFGEFIEVSQPVLMENLEYGQATLATE